MCADTNLAHVWLLLLSSHNNTITITLETQNKQKLGLYSLSGKTSYRKIPWSLEAAGFGSKLFQSLWNLAGTSAALLPRCLSNFRAIRPLQHTISWLRDFTRFGGKTSNRLVNRGPAVSLETLPIRRGNICVITLPSSAKRGNFRYTWYTNKTRRLLMLAFRIFVTISHYVARWDVNNPYASLLVRAGFSTAIFRITL